MIESITNLAGTADAGVNKLIGAAQKNTTPKFDTIISVAFTYTEGGRWHAVDLNFHEYLNVLQTGHIDGKPICAIEVSVTNADNEEGDKIKMIYDFMLLHTERNPWRMA